LANGIEFYSPEAYASSKPDSKISMPSSFSYLVVLRDPVISKLWEFAESGVRKFFCKRLDDK
jgi:hypothetical protein